MSNLFPVFTFALAVIFRLERIKLKEKKTIAKLTGTVIALGGSLLMALYSGPLIASGELRIGKKNHGESNGSNLLGFVLFSVACIARAGFTILQTIVLWECPHALSLASLICFTGTIESSLTAMVAEHGRSPGWLIGWEWKAFFVVYSAIVTIVSYYGLGSLLENKGTVFVTAFSPVMTVFTTLTGLFLTGEDLFLGGLMGALIIFLGLFSVLWGKSRDEVPQRTNDGDQVKVDQV